MFPAPACSSGSSRRRAAEVERRKRDPSAVRAPGSAAGRRCRPPLRGGAARAGPRRDRRVQAPLAVGRSPARARRPPRDARRLRARRRRRVLDPDRGTQLRRPPRGPARGARPPRPCRSCARTSSSTPTSCTRPASAGADAVLLIVAALSQEELVGLHAAGARAGPRRAGRGARRARARAGAGGGGADGRHQQPRPARLQRRRRSHRAAAGPDPDGTWRSSRSRASAPPSSCADSTRRGWQPC